MNNKESQKYSEVPVEPRVSWGGCASTLEVVDHNVAYILQSVTGRLEAFDLLLTCKMANPKVTSNFLQIESCAAACKAGCTAECAETSAPAKYMPAQDQRYIAQLVSRKVASLFSVLHSWPQGLLARGICFSLREVFFDMTIGGQPAGRSLVAQLAALMAAESHGFFFEIEN